MKLRDLCKMNKPNDGTRTLFESIAIPEVEQALKDWNSNYRGNCVLIGGTAVGYYTKPRSTTDIDILFLSKQDIPTQVSKFKRTRPGALLHTITHVEVEVISPETINIPISLVKEVFTTAVLSNGIKVASPSGLVALKLFRMHRYDLGDIWSLIETGQVDLDNWPLPLDKLEIYHSIIQQMS